MRLVKIAGITIIGFFALMWLVMGSFDFLTDPQDDNQKSETVQNSAWDGSVHQVKAYLKNTLKDPGSFEATEWSKVEKTADGYMVRCQYRAKNSFGGYVITNQIFLMDAEGNVIAARNVSD
jgi:hypothetical protein